MVTDIITLAILFLLLADRAYYYYGYISVRRSIRKNSSTELDEETALRELDVEYGRFIPIYLATFTDEELDALGQDVKAARGDKTG